MGNAVVVFWASLPLPATELLPRSNGRAAIALVPEAFATRRSRGVLGDRVTGSSTGGCFAEWLAFAAGTSGSGRCNARDPPAT